jgi:hypothetical protein
MFWDESTKLMSQGGCKDHFSRSFFLKVYDGVISQIVSYKLVTSSSSQVGSRLFYLARLKTVWMKIMSCFILIVELEQLLN